MGRRPNWGGDRSYSGRFSCRAAFKAFSGPTIIQRSKLGIPRLIQRALQLALGMVAAAFGSYVNLAMEMTMRVMSGNRIQFNTTEIPVGRTYWATEFERIYLMTAARVRGKPAVAGQCANISRPVFVRGR